MVARPDTLTGTITLTSGQAAFTTSGVQMLTRGHLAGDTIYRNGLVLIIGAVTGENSGTLLDPCPAGAAGVDVPVRIRFQPDGSRVAAQTRNLIDVVGNGALQSVAEESALAVGGEMIRYLGPNSVDFFDGKNVFAEAQIDGTGGNWLSYFTGIGAKARTALTAKARALIALSANADILQEIGAQPSDADLTAIAAVTTQPFGRSLLAGASASAVWSLLGADGTASSGWVKLPNGLIMQAGTTVVTTDANGGYPILLPTSYPTLHRTALLCTGDASVNPSRHDVISMPLHGINGKANGIVSGPVRVNWFSWGW